jgi:lipopolysaccharide/colanic/teichoic acid biosynthesis glycosyltransferase
MKFRSSVKYIFDRIFALLAIILLIPVFLIISIIMLVRIGKPLIFKQKRAGKDGRLFTIFKFRTMYKNIDRNTVSTSKDSRITPEGAFLRRWKLDELPELVNVLKGDMSFVGPRPDMPGYAASLSGEGRKILSMRPGITGPATLKYIDEEEILANVPDPVKYNDEVIFPDKVKINLKYCESYSLLGDIKLIYYTLIRKKIDEY